jgi:phospholipid/cholesterol/gamma-HCH transport system substrate-binding protein
MRRSAYITWDQLKVGLMVVVGIAVLTLAMFKLGQAANLFSSRYEIVAFLPDANGLRPGGSVMVAGQLVGSVEDIEVMPVDFDTTRNIKVVMSINEDMRQQIRSDSRARLRSLGLLGDKVMDISPGTPRQQALGDGDTVRTQPAMDYEAVLAQAAGAVDDVVALTRDMRTLTGGLVRGEGTVGQLITNKSLYDQLEGTLERTNAMLTRLQNPNGSVGRFIDDPTLYNRAVGTISSVDQLVKSVNSPQGSVGRLLGDTTLYVNLVGTTRKVDSLISVIATGNGLAGRLLNDQTLYDQLVKSVTDLNAILEQVRRDPRPFTRGLVNVCVFGCKKD